MGKLFPFKKLTLKYAKVLMKPSAFLYTTLSRKQKLAMIENNFFIHFLNSEMGTQERLN